MVNYSIAHRFLVEELDGNIEVADFDGKTPLHDGAQFSHVDVVRYLISKGYIFFTVLSNLAALLIQKPVD